MTKFGDASIKREGDIVDPDECTWECDCEKCQAKYQKWKAAYDDKGKGEHMTGFHSKQAAAQAKLTEDDDIQDYKKPWVGLTDEEVEQLAVDAGIVTWLKRSYDTTAKKFYDLPVGEGMEGDGISLKQFADLVSTKLKQKNT